MRAPKDADLDALQDRLRAQVAELEAELKGFHSERSYIVGANAGWEAAVEQGEASPAVEKAMVRFWKRLAETHLSRAEKAEAELARLRGLIAALDPDYFGLQARVVAFKAEAMKEGGDNGR